MIKIIISIIIMGFTLAALMKAAGKKTPQEGERKICIYNEQVRCYEVPCKYCPSIRECQLVCSDDCDNCVGIRVVKNNK